MRRRRLLYLALCLAIIGLLAGAQWWRPRALDDLRDFTFDTFQRLAPPAYDPTAPVRIVAIDEKSLAALGQWPWPRSRLAELTRRLAELGAAAVGFDVIFAEPDRTSIEAVAAGLPAGTLKTDLLARIDPDDTNDARFAVALGAVPSVLGATLQANGAAPVFAVKAGIAVAGDDPKPFVPAFPSIVLPLDQLGGASAGLGATNWLPDRDQMVRRVPLVLRVGETVVPSLALEMLRVGQGASTLVLRASNASGVTAFGAATGLNAVKVGEVSIDTDPQGAIRPRYTAASSERFVSAADVLAGTIDPDIVRGRLILVGTTAVGLGDVRATPLGAAIPGVEVHAQVLEQMLSGRLLSRPDWAPGAEMTMTLGLLALLGALFPLAPPLVGTVATALVVALLLTASWFAFDRAGVLLDAAVPSVAIAIAYFGIASILWQTERRAKRQVRLAFGKFVAPAVVDKIAENPALLVLSGETRELSILFADLRNFSTISEALEAHEVARFLNSYLTPMTNVILHHEGTVDKYIGDAIVAFWNAPLDVPDHPARAVAASLAMRAALAAFNIRQAARAAAGDAKAVVNVRMGIGLNVGACSVGNMGSVQRFDYSALGDPVNVAARLEALTKTYGVDVLATPAVQARTASHAWLEVDAVRVKGRAASTTLFTLAGSEAFALTPAFATWRTAHDAMLDARRRGHFADAAAAANRLAETCDPVWRPLYRTLAERDTAESAAPVSIPSPAAEQLLGSA